MKLICNRIQVRKSMKVHVWWKPVSEVMGGGTVSVTGGRTTDLSVTLGPDLGRSGRNERDVCNRVNRALVVQDSGAAGTTGKHIVKR